MYFIGGIPVFLDRVKDRRGVSLKMKGTPVRYNLEIPFSMYLNYCISFMRGRASRRKLSSRFVPQRPELSEIHSEEIGTE
jgi:hypothetical protein